MPIMVMMTGSVVRAVEQRTSKNGKTYSICTIFVPNSFPGYWKALAWDEPLRATMLRLRDGDTVTVQGSMQVLESDDDRRDTMLVNVTQLQAMKMAAAQPAAHTAHEKRKQTPRRSRRNKGQREVKTAVVNGNTVTGAAYSSIDDDSCPF